MSFATLRQDPNRQSASPSSNLRNGPLQAQQQHNQAVNDHKISEDLDELSKMIQQFQKKEKDLKTSKQKQIYLSSCRTLANKIYNELQTSIKRSENNQGLRFSKLYSEQNRKLQRLEQEVKQQGELENQAEEQGNEDDNLLDQQQDFDDIGFQIFEENVQERKQRLYNAHSRMSTVKNVFSQIAEVATQQVDQMLAIEKNYSKAELKTREASKELLKAQGAQRQNLTKRLYILIILVVAIIFLLIKIRNKH